MGGPFLSIYTSDSQQIILALRLTLTLLLIPRMVPAQVAGIYEGQGNCISQEPGDPDGAANDNYIVQKVNLCTGITNRTSGVTTYQFDDVFWGTPAGSSKGDGRVYWDTLSQRWYYAERSLENGVMGVRIGISTTTNPTPIQNIFLPGPNSGAFDRADQPQLGFKGKWLVLSVQLWTDTGSPYIAVWPKANVFAGNWTPISTRTDLSLAAPCETFDPNMGAEWFIRNPTTQANGSTLLTGSNSMLLTNITGPATAPGWTDNAGTPHGDQVFKDFDIESVSQQAASPKPVLNGPKSSRTNSCVAVNRTIYFAHTIQLPMVTSALNAATAMQPSFVGHYDAEGEGAEVSLSAPTGVQPGQPARPWHAFCCNDLGDHRDQDWLSCGS